MSLLWLLACSSPSTDTERASANTPAHEPAPQGAASDGDTIPEAAAAPNSATIPEAAPSPGPTNTGDPQAAFSSVPATIQALYDLSLAADRSTFTADPARISGARRAARGAGFKTEDTRRGGKRVRLEGGPIVQARWRRVTLASLISEPGQVRRAEQAGFGLDRERDVLEVRTEPAGEPTTFAFSEDASKRGLLGICSEVTVVDFGAPAPQVAVRKPVIYAYPEHTRALSIEVEPEGGITVAYPQPSPDGWKVLAHPDGTLETNGRNHRYLFWEGRTPSLPLDRKRAFSVPREDVPSFLEQVCDAYALTDAECGDFVTYWLPELVIHPHVLVDFPARAYEQYAPLTISPEPDTTIRLFMVFEGHDQPVDTEPPALPRHERHGFTVVEWGGAELPRFGR